MATLNPYLNRRTVQQGMRNYPTPSPAANRRRVATTARLRRTLNMNPVQRQYRQFQRLAGMLGH